MATTSQRERVYALLNSGERNSKTIARRVRLPVASVRAYRANWTRGNGIQPTPVVTSTRSSSSSSRSSTSTGSMVTVKIRNKSLSKALRSGSSVNLVLDI